MGLIQYAIENEGIPTISISHLVNLTKKIRVPRALHLSLPLGRSFGVANNHSLQRKIILDMLHYLEEFDQPETIVKLPYRWKEIKKG